jgi:transposase-like protein
MKWPAWLKLVRSRKPASPTACPQCGRKMIYVEKYTMSGEDLRTYRCDHCGKEHTLNFGTAMWKLMSDANKSEE